MLDLSEEHRPPEHGPRILFFSGGSALRPLTRALKQRTHNSIHIITPFDSGGSSGPLRRAFGMPAVGDLRNRLLALADDRVEGNAEIQALLGRRLDRHASPDALRSTLAGLVAGNDPLIAAVGEAARAYARSRLGVVAERLPEEFDLRGASIGNLVLAGAWLSKPDLAAAIADFGALLSVRGEVHPTVEADLHLAVETADGQTIVGQHQITGKEVAELESPIRDLWLVRGSDATERALVDAPDSVIAAIRSAALICFPIGSFFSSVLCNLLPAGIGRAVADARCPKVYIPNLQRDPEQNGVRAADATRLLMEALRQDAGGAVEPGRLLDLVLLDSSSESYAEPPDREAISRLGVRVVEIPICDADPGGPPTLAPLRLAEALMRLAENPSSEATN